MDAEPETNRTPLPSLIAAFHVAALPTKQQSQALSLRAGGATLSDVAIELGVKLSTVTRLLREGMATLGVSCQAELIAALGGPAVPCSMPECLTPAEREVVSMVLRGSSNRDIALCRGTSVRTVANQLQSVYARLGVGSRRELVAALIGAPDPALGS
jgi:DNA-binding CsgD family transcriptional regulator